MKRKINYIIYIIIVFLITITPSANYLFPQNTSLVQSAYSYEKGVLVTHWTGCVAPRYMGQSNVSHTYGASWFDEEDVAWIANQGFDHIQIDVDEQLWFSEDSIQNIKNVEIYKKAVQWANNKNLGVILYFDVHPFGKQPDPMDKNIVEKRASQWKKIAELFKSNQQGIRFHFGDQYLPKESKPNERITKYIQAVREIDEQRFIYVNIPLDNNLKEPSDNYLYNSYSALTNSLEQFNIEIWDKNIAISFEYFFPEVFLYQKENQSPKVYFPGKVPDFSKSVQDTTFFKDYVKFAKTQIGNTISEKQVSKDFEKIAQLIRQKNKQIKIYLKRFGVHPELDKNSSIKYAKAILKAAKKFNMAWCVYDYESGRAIRNKEGKSNPIMLGLGLKKATNG
jgi:hypothetical protein